MPVSIAITDDHLVAIVSLIPPGKGEAMPEVADVVRELKAREFSFALSKDLIERALQIFNTTRRGRSKFRIYEDSFRNLEQYFEVRITENQMLAYMNVSILPDLAQKVKYDFLKRLLMKNGISSGVLVPELNQLVQMLPETPTIEKYLVASGKQEILAVDGELKLHEFFRRFEKIERIIKKGSSRRKLVLKAKVTEGPLPEKTVLLIKYLPVEGKEGLTVTNQHLWSEANKKQIVDPVVVLSKNVTARKFHDRVEYVSTVNGIGYFIDGKILEVIEVLDGEFLLSPSDDKMALLLSLQAARGGKELDLGEIRKALEKMKLKVPVNMALLAREVARVNNGEVEHVTRTMIARGVKPVDGANGQLEWYTNLEQFYQPRILEDGSVDYRGGQCYPYAREGAPVAIWYLATKGVKPGHDIFGTPIPPEDGKKIAWKFSSQFSIEDAVSEKKDAKLLIPGISGLIKIKRDEVVIDPVFEVDSVDYSTGNIDFEGTLIIKNTIAEGFSVRCSKDLHIKGNVGACRLECEGDIIIQGGMNGRGKGQINAGGKVHIKFAENCTIHADQGIYVSSHVVLSRLVSRQKILVGINRTKGKIIGSHLFAWDSIETNMIGTKSSTADSHLYVGLDKLLYDKVQQRKKDIEVLKLEITRLQKQVGECGAGEDGKRQMLEEQLREEVAFLNEELAACREWEENVYNPEPGSILAKDEIQAHTGLYFGQVEFELVVNKGKMEFRLEEDKVAQIPLQRKR